MGDDEEICKVKDERPPLAIVRLKDEGVCQAHGDPPQVFIFCLSVRFLFGSFISLSPVLFVKSDKP